MPEAPTVQKTEDRDIGTEPPEGAQETGGRESCGQESGAPVPEETGMADPLRIDVGLGQRAMVLGDLLLPAEATASSSALAADVALTLEQWQGPGTVIFCGNLFEMIPAASGCTPEEGTGGTAGDQVAQVLASHPRLATAMGSFAARDDCRLLILPGWRDSAIGHDRSVLAHLGRLGAEVAGSVELSFETAAGERRVLVRPGQPLAGPGDASGADRHPWLAGIDRLEDPAASGRFVSSRTLYRRLGRFTWVPPVVAVVAAIVIHFTIVFHGVYHLVHRAAGPRHVLVRAYSASWPSRLLFTLVAIGVLELLVAIAAAGISRRIWKRYGGGALPTPWSPRPFSERWPDIAQQPPASDNLAVAGSDALDEARALMGEGLTGLVAGGGLRAELTHLGSGFFASPGGTTELVREHAGRAGLPPVFLHHRQASWIELEAGADLHVRLLLADVDLPSSTGLERLATGYNVIKGYKQTADLNPSMVASWPRGTSWPTAPAITAGGVRARRVRRLAAAAIFLAGLFDLLLAVSRPAAGDLVAVSRYMPLGVAQAAGALVGLAGIGLIMLARGVLRGQRRAWAVATALLAGSLVLHVVHGGSISDLFVSGLVLLLLLTERDLFGAASDHASARTAGTTLVIGGLAAVGAATAAIELSGRVRHHVLPSWPHVLLGATERLVGLHAVPLPDAIDDWASPSLLAVGVALVVVTVYLLTRPVVDRRLSASALHSTEEAAAVQPGAPDLESRHPPHTARLREASARRAAEHRARDIVRRHGTGTLDYFALRDDKQWFFHRDTLVAYAVYSGTCLVSPDPIGPFGERVQAWDAFRRFSDRQGWTPAVMAAAEEWLPIYRANGMRHLYIGDEALVDVQRFSLQGGKMKGLRQAVNRVERYGYSVEFLDPARVGPVQGRPLVELMEKHRRGEQERGFSMMLGRIFDPRDTGLLLTAVYGPDRRPAAMCQFVPSAAINGYSLDLMRRDPGEHPNGLLDFALCSTIEHLRKAGGRGLSLNFAAMRAVLDGERGDGVAVRMERWALERMSTVLQIESLWRFNAKYGPRWQPRYALYDAAEHLVPALVAIVRAESLWDVPVLGKLVTAAERRRGSTGGAGIVVATDGAGVVPADGADGTGPGAPDAPPPSSRPAPTPVGDAAEGPVAGPAADRVPGPASRAPSPPIRRAAGS